MNKLLIPMLIILFAFGCTTQQQRPAHIQKLITDNTAKSLHEAAGLYEYGEGVQKNITEAAKLYYQSAKKGNYHSSYAIHRLREQLYTLNDKSPLEWEQIDESKKDAIAGYTWLLLKHPEDPEIYYRLGQLYESGVGENNQENKTSTAMMLKAAGLGHKEAMEYLIFYSEVEQQVQQERKAGKQ